MNDPSAPKEKRVTINDIARASGYSKTAVSFAFNAPSRISEKTCATILQIAKEMGYYPNPLARNFALQCHQSIGFLLPKDINYSFRNPYIMEVVGGIGSVCQKYGTTLTLIPPLHASMLQAVHRAAVDGLITQGMRVETEIVDAIIKRNLPFVTLDGVPSTQVPSVNINDKQAAYDIMHLVLAAGHRHIVIVGFSEASYAKKDFESIQRVRLQGYLEALEEFCLNLSSPTIAIHFCECTLEAGRNFATTLLQKELPTCIVTMCDITAMGIMVAFKAHKIAVPATISLVGFDNIPEATYQEPPLTTVDQPGVDKGKRAAELLFSLINKEPIAERHIEMPYAIMQRGSLGPPRDCNL